MATISIDASDLTIDVQGMDRLWTFKSRLTIPLRNDEDHVCARSAQPPRVPVGRSLMGLPLVADDSELAG